jgi:hypothetical protein
MNILDLIKERKAIGSIRAGTGIPNCVRCGSSSVSAISLTSEPCRYCEADNSWKYEYDLFSPVIVVFADECLFYQWLVVSCTKCGKWVYMRPRLHTKCNSCGVEVDWIVDRMEEGEKQ